MSKINAVRFINLNYNNNAMKINDECMQFSGKSTLLSLRNGGGKTVLVQMMTAPFVHRGKQKTKDRPFESYFTTAKPSFILVEWLLDGGAGYVLTGLMVRKNQEISEEKTDALEMMAIISEYKEPCMQDIHHLPVVEQNEKTMKLKSYNSCRKLFEDYKKDKKLSFFCYDMSSPAQSRQYFYKLMEYQINYKEWETIIRKVNVKESGLSELFSDCRTEKELVEKWFLEAVESSVRLIKAKKEAKKIDFIIDIDENDVCTMHIGEFQTILINLLDNACYWLRNAKNKKIKISAKLSSNNKNMEIVVSDNGPGIIEEEKQKIFQPGVTAKPQGIGMGLVIVTELLNNHNCKIRLETPGEYGGATFAFEVPME